MRHTHTIGFAGFLLAFLATAAAWAVPATPSVPSAQPGQVQQNLQIENARPEVGGPSIITVPDEGGKGKRLEAGVTFKLKGVVFENLTVFTQEQLRPEYEKYIGTNATLATLNTIASNVTVRYRNAGYILSRAVVPPQRIGDGIAKIRIVEGYVNKVTIEGAPDKGLLAAYAEKIRTSKPLDAATLERYLLLIEDLPGVSAHAVLRPSQGAPGASDVVITITQKSYDGSVTLDNRGTRYLGPWEGGITASANNMLGIYDRTTLHGVTAFPTHEMRYGQISNDEQLDSEGTKLTLSAGYTHTQPGFRLTPFDVNGRDVLYSAEVSHPFIRSRQSNLFGDVKFDVRQTDTDALGFNLYDDKLRVGRIGGAYDFVDRFMAVNRIETELSKGFNWGTSSNTGLHSRATGTPDFTKATAQASRLQPIAGPVSLYIAGTGQWSANTLLTAEQMGLGGPNFGSAYDPSEITGDSGAAGRLELQYNRSGDFRYLPSYQLYGFYDIGTVWNRNVGAGQKSPTSLADAGIGTRFNIMEPLSGDLELAFPLTRPVAANNTGANNDGNGARLFLSLAFRY